MKNIRLRDLPMPALLILNGAANLEVLHWVAKPDAFLRWGLGGVAFVAGLWVLGAIWLRAFGGSAP